MDLALLIPLIIKVSIFLTVLGFALHARIDDALYLFRHPSELFRSLMSMNVIMPLFAASLAANFGLHPAVKIALITLAISPVPPLLPKKELKAGGRASYAIGLLAAAALLAILIVPISMGLMGKAFGRNVHIAPSAIAQLVFLTVLIPLTLGIGIRHLAPAIAERIAGPISLVAVILLIAGALPILFVAWPSIVNLVGDGTIIAIAAFSMIGLLTGHLLGGPDPDDRTVLALSTVSRHPGVAMAVAAVNFPAQKMVLGAVLLYLLINTFVSTLYLTWRRRHQPELAGAIKT